MADRVRLLERRDVDELIILDISATPNNRGPRFEEIKQLCSDLFMPITVGGGVRNCNDIQRLLASGADKVAINTAAVKNPQFIKDAATKFGSQAVVVSIDVNSYGQAKIRCGSSDAGFTAVELASDVEALGAGEILLTSIDRDGTLSGYDLDLIRCVSSAVDIPVIAAGGCGSYQHMQEALAAGAHAVASGAMFQFMDATPKGAARHLHQHGIPTRL